MDRRDEEPVVLVVEDEESLADLFASWLEATYSVRTAYTGEQAAAAMDGEVDVILLDRRLPGISGDEFLAQLRGAGYDCQVVVISAVEPDVDILEMGFNEYLVKPVRQDELLETVSRALAIDAVDQTVQDYFALRAKKDTLEGEIDPQELEAHDEYTKLLEDLERFEAHVLSLAETYLEREHGPSSDEGAQHDNATIATWRERKSELTKGDPLYRLAEERIREHEAAMAPADDDSDPRRQFLEVIAEGFIAEGFWLDARILRALNLIFYETDEAVFRIQGTALQENVQLTSSQRFELSKAVREQADWLL